MPKNNGDKWSREQQQTLIEAYREETCLYDTKLKSYHNKNVRRVALQRVCNNVQGVRPGTTAEDCVKKFSNLRSHFSAEYWKRIDSMKSGAGAEDVYEPTIWYFELMLFIREHIIPRKNKTSRLPNSDMETGNTNNMIAEGFNNNGELQVLVHESEAIYDAVHLDEDGGEEEYTQDQTYNEDAVSYPGTSSSSTSGTKSRKKKVTEEASIAAAMQNIADCLKVPVSASEPALSSTEEFVDSSMNFLKCTLKSFKSERLITSVVKELIDVVIKAKESQLEG